MIDGKLWQMKGKIYYILKTHYLWPIINAFFQSVQSVESVQGVQDYQSVKQHFNITKIPAA